MAALLDFVHLRRHAMPDNFDIGRIPQPADRDPGMRRERRPRLVASWHVGADGRLACTWSATPDDPA